MDSKQTLSPPGEAQPQRISRRAFLRRFGGMTLGAVMMGAGGLTYVTRIEPDWVDFTRIELSLPRLHPAFAGFRLAQVSDIHLSHSITGPEVAEVCQKIIDWQPDLVVLTGDYVDPRRNIPGLLSDLLEALRPLAGNVRTVAILGNHDYNIGASGGVRRMLREAGIPELKNQVLTLTRSEAEFHIAGVDDYWFGRASLKRVLNQLPETGSALLLAHEPDFADISARSGRFDLQLSGHTHGGQVVLPLVGPLVLPHLGEKYPSGLYRVGSMLQYTNRGLGMTEPHVRFNCRPEVTFFTLQPGEGSDEVI